MRLSFAVIVSLAFALCGMLVAPASGAILEVQFSGMNLVYNGTDLFDAGGAVGGTGAPAQADPLMTMSFLVDGVVQGQLTRDIAIDALVKGLSGIPAGGGAVLTGGNANLFGVDLLTQATPSAAWGLALNIDKFNFFYSGNKVAIATSGQSTSLFSQALPFGLAFDPSQPISIVLSSANLTGLTTAGGFVTGFHAAGTGNISGTLLPEPTTMLLLAMSGLALLRRRTR